MNFSESRQNRSRENREKSKNRFFSPTPSIRTAAKSKCMKILVKKAHCSVCVGVLVSYYPQQRDYRANYQQFEIIKRSFYRS